jgi:carbon monoxide dehydrogenase subunit G
VTPDDIDVRLTQSIGPMTATFAANVRIVERVPEKLIQFTAAGRSVRGAMGNVRATVTVQVEPAGDRTVVMVEGDVVLAGALGSVGQKVAANLEAALSGGRSRATTVPAASAGGTTAAAGRPLNTGSLPAFTADRSSADPWPKVAAALSAVSVLLSIVALRGSRRRGRR